MSKTATVKPTPGPWRKGEMCGGTIAIEADNPGATVARVHVYFNGDSTPAEANTHLIVAACNACQKINPENPQAVAEALPELFDHLHVMMSGPDLRRGELVAVTHTLGRLLNRMTEGTKGA